TAYGSAPDLGGALMIGISQSGGSPDLIQALRGARAQGAMTLAVTNDPTSELANVAEHQLEVRAGTEHAVAATKSYTAELLTLYLLLDRVRGGDGAAATRLPELAEQLLSADGRVAEMAQRYRFVQRLVTTARGYSYPTAREAALKLMETCYLSAQAFSGAELLHGPLAMVQPQVPVFTVVPGGLGGRAMAPVMPRIEAQGAEMFCVGTADAVRAAGIGVVLPEGVAEEVSPLLEIIPVQLLARHLALARGGNPASPRGLHKVTETL